MFNTATAYVVEARIIIDRPQLRDASFPAVAPGHVVNFRQACESLKEALGLFDSMVSGGWDFGSEYVACASVKRTYTSSSPRWIRRPVERTRRPVAVVRFFKPTSIYRVLALESRVRYVVPLTAA